MLRVITWEGGDEQRFSHEQVLTQEPPNRSVPAITPFRVCVCKCHTSKSFEQLEVSVRMLKCMAFQVTWSKISPLLCINIAFVMRHTHNDPCLQISLHPILIFIGNQRDSKGVWYQIKAMACPWVNHCVCVCGCVWVGGCVYGAGEVLHLCDCQ